jgi:hypothetical protein
MRSVIVDGAVNLYCTFSLDDGVEVSASGSGVFIDERGVILTNAHVAEYFLLADRAPELDGVCSVRMGSPAREHLRASVFYISDSWMQARSAPDAPDSKLASGESDFALLYVTDELERNKLDDIAPLPFAVLPRIYTADTIAVAAGYAIGDTLYEEIQGDLRREIAEVTVRNSGSFDGLPASDALTLAASSVSANGSSGGPVLDASGNLIGIVTSMSTSKDAPQLRAITLPYIDRKVRIETGGSLYALLDEDYEATRRALREWIPKGMLAELVNTAGE